MAGEEAQKLGTEACLFTMLRMNICLVKKKKTERKKEEEEEEGGKETVVLMLLEQQPTRMTKLRLKPFSPQLDSHECWKIEIVFLLSDVSNTSTNVSNGLCKPTV